MAAARAAVVAGFAGTSNLEAGRRYGLTTIGTAAHSFTLLHDDEQAAFASQVAALGTGTTLLVDTYDVRQGVRRAVEAAGPGLGAVRLDSGDLPSLAREVRAQLDGLGATATRIVVSSDLDEYAIAALAAAPVDSYGVGTSVVTGSGAPTCGMVYKLVARQDADGAMRGGCQDLPGQVRATRAARRPAGGRPRWAAGGSPWRRSWSAARTTPCARGRGTRRPTCARCTSADVQDGRGCSTAGPAPAGVPGGSTPRRLARRAAVHRAAACRRTTRPCPTVRRHGLTPGRRGLRAAVPVTRRHGARSQGGALRRERDLVRPAP